MCYCFSCVKQFKQNKQWKQCKHIQNVHIVCITQQEKVACLTDQNPSDQGCRAFIPPQYCNCVFFANIPRKKQIIFMNSCHSFCNIIACQRWNSAHISPNRWNYHISTYLQPDFWLLVCPLSMVTLLSLFQAPLVAVTVLLTEAPSITIAVWLVHYATCSGWVWRATNSWNLARLLAGFCVAKCVEWEAQFQKSQVPAPTGKVTGTVALQRVHCVQETLICWYSSLV